jgi:lipopolysaccharide export system protein LptA
VRNRILPVAFAIALFSLSSAVAGKPITFSSDRMSGAAGKKTESTSLIGNAKVTVGTLTITGERIDLTGTDYRYVKATGSITGVDSEKGYSFTADELSYDRETEVATFRGNAKLLDTAHEVEASAGIITYNQQTEVALLQLIVKLKKNKIDCTSGFALYRRTVSMLELTGSPYVLRDGDEFKADRISVNLDTEHITLDGTVSGTLKKDDGKNEEGAAGDGTTDGETTGDEKGGDGKPDGDATGDTKAPGLKKSGDKQEKDTNQ